MKLKKILINKYEMSYLDQGEGNPVILVHGSLSDFRSWEHQIDAFRTEYRIIVPSLRHCYPDKWNGENGDFSILRHAEDLAEFIAALNLKEDVHLVGHSRGGAVILKMAVQFPYLFHSAVLADPAPFVGLFKDNLNVSQQIEQRNNMVAASIELILKGNLDRGLETFTDSVSVPGTWQSLPEEAKQIRRDNAWSLKSLISDCQESIRCEDIKRMKHPILLLTGENSPGVYAGMHKKLEFHIKNTQKAVIKNASHGMHRDNPEVFNSIVLDFLNTHSGRTQ